MTTFLLARSVSGTNPPQAQRLLHALKKAGVVAIRYHGNRDLVEPLATAIGVRPASFTAATRTAMVNSLQDKFPGKVVLVIGSRDDVSAILRQISADMTTPQLIVRLRYRRSGCRPRPKPRIWFSLLECRREARERCFCVLCPGSRSEALSDLRLEALEGVKSHSCASIFVVGPSRTASVRSETLRRSDHPNKKGRG